MTKETTMLCKDCKHLKSRAVGHVSYVNWYGLVGDGRQKTSIGVYPWYEKPHPKCPLRREGE